MDGRWSDHRRRAEALAARYPYAAELLTLYLALIDVWEEAAAQAGADRPDPVDLPQWTVERVLPDVLKATEAAGPAGLHAGARDALAAGDPAGLMAAWLSGGELGPVERYLARAALTAQLSTMDAAAACAADPSPRGEGRCPRCGGAPQLSFRSAGEDGLVTGRRNLLCVRCGHGWAYSASTCPSCGETAGAKRTVYGERPSAVVGRGDADAGTATLPHLRVEACASCQRYLVDVDLGRDPHAVPEVDELVALPLDLYATELGHTKTTPNLMGV